MIVKSATSSRVPTIQLPDSQGAQAEINREMVSPEVVVKYLEVDHDFLDTYDMELGAGEVDYLEITSATATEAYREDF